MPAHESLSGIQFNYIEPGMHSSGHHLTAHDTEGRHLGGMEWDARKIRSIDVNPDVRRQGVGTALWNQGHALAAENARVPAPKHSDDRTAAGDAWARSVGGRLPRRRK